MIMSFDQASGILLNEILDQKIILSTFPVFLYLLLFRQLAALKLQFAGNLPNINTEVAVRLAAVITYAKLTPEEKQALSKLFIALEKNPEFKGKYLPVVKLYETIIALEFSLEETISLLKDFFAPYAKIKATGLSMAEFNPEKIRDLFKQINVRAPRSSVPDVVEKLTLPLNEDDFQVLVKKLYCGNDTLEYCCAAMLWVVLRLPKRYPRFGKACKGYRMLRQCLLFLIALIF